MRFRSVGTGVETNKIDDSFVVSDDYHMDKIGLDVLGHNCYFVDSPESVFDVAPTCKRVTVLDTHVGRILESYKNLSHTQFRNNDFIFTLITIRGRFWAIFEQLIYAQEMNTASVTELSFHDNSAIISFRSSVPEDADVSIFLAGLQFQKSMPELQESETEEICGRCDELEGKLFDLLRILPLAVPRSFQANATENTTTPLRDEAKSLQVSINEQAVELDRLKRSNTALATKYEALANSKLGRLTLRYWNWRKGKPDERDS